MKKSKILIPVITTPVIGCSVLPLVACKNGDDSQKNTIKVNAIDGITQSNPTYKSAKHNITANEQYTYVITVAKNSEDETGIWPPCFMVTYEENIGEESVWSLNFYDDSVSFMINDKTITKGTKTWSIEHGGPSGLEENSHLIIIEKDLNLKPGDVIKISLKFKDKFDNAIGLASK